MMVLGFTGSGLVSVVLHELGHAIAAWSLGYKVVEIRIGSGKTLLRREIGHVSVVIGRAFREGMVQAVPPISNSAVAAFLFTAAGPMANVALIFIYIDIAETFVRMPHVDALMFGAIVNQVLTLLLNLWPRKVVVNGARLPNDGLSLCDIVSGRAKRMRRAGQEKMLEAYPVQCADAAKTTELSQHALFLIAKLHIVDDSKKAGLLEALGEEVGMLPPSSGKLVMLDKLVTYFLARAPDTDLDKLDAWSRSALDLAPESKTLRGSRGAVLVEMGRYDEGLEMLAQAEYGNAFDRCINEAYRGLAFLRLGDLTQAKVALEAAKSGTKSVDSANTLHNIILGRVGREMTISLKSPT